jgi:hypothetical protein
LLPRSLIQVALRGTVTACDSAWSSAHRERHSSAFLPPSNNLFTTDGPATTVVREFVAFEELELAARSINERRSQMNVHPGATLHSILMWIWTLSSESVAIPTQHSSLFFLAHCRIALTRVHCPRVFAYAVMLVWIGFHLESLSGTTTPRRRCGFEPSTGSRIPHLTP